MNQTECAQPTFFLRITLGSSYYYYPCFTEEETEVQRG